MSNTITIPTFETNGAVICDWIRINRPDVWAKTRLARVFTGQKIPVWHDGEVVQEQDKVALVDISDTRAPYYLGLVNHPDGSKELQYVVSHKIKR